MNPSIKLSTLPLDEGIQSYAAFSSDADRIDTINGLAGFLCQAATNGSLTPTVRQVAVDFLTQAAITTNSGLVGCEATDALGRFKSVAQDLPTVGSVSDLVESAYVRIRDEAHNPSVRTMAEEMHATGASAYSAQKKNNASGAYNL